MTTCDLAYRIAELEKQSSALQIEQSKLKEIAEVASSQVRAFESQQISRDKGASLSGMFDTRFFVSHCRLCLHDCACV